VLRQVPIRITKLVWRAVALTSSNLYSTSPGGLAEAGRIKSSHKTAIAGWTGSVLRSALVYS